MQPKYWIVTVTPEPAMGGDQSKTIVRLLVWTASGEQPPFAFVISALNVIGVTKEMNHGIKRSTTPAPDDAKTRTTAETPPDWSIQAMKLWVLGNE